MFNLFNVLKMPNIKWAHDQLWLIYHVIHLINYINCSAALVILLRLNFLEPFQYLISIYCLLTAGFITPKFPNTVMNINVVSQSAMQIHWNSSYSRGEENVVAALQIWNSYSSCLLFCTPETTEYNRCLAVWRSYHMTYIRASTHLSCTALTST